MYVLAIFLLTAFLSHQTGADNTFIQLSKVTCQCPNANICTFEKCRLKAIRRNVAQLTINATIHRRHITNSLLNIDLYRKYTTYNSFPFNQTLDACYFLKNSRKLPIINKVFKMLENKTNLNHNCPFDEPYLYVENVTAVYSKFFSFIPAGSYLAKTSWTVDNTLWALINVWIEMNNPDNTFLSK